MHRILITLLVSLSITISCAQFYQNRNWPIGNRYPNYLHNYFALPKPSYFEARSPGNRNEERIFTDFFTTQTFTLTTTTSTRTVTLTATCTTSTAALKACSLASKRRKRNLLIASKLFHEEEEDEIVLPTNSINNNNHEPVETVERIDDEEEQISTVPFMVQPGFSAPEGVGSGRWLLAIGTSTVRATTTKTWTVSITAVCASTTGYPTCKASG